ncbi:MAG: hypothetical protein OEX07_02170 [Gammaproteobacteria bacterium]|nr:hypothetical protein [Gammaproteobacteria bacterium]
MNYRYFAILSASILISACAKSETPHYILTDSELHQYQGGDRLSYAVLALTNNTDTPGVLIRTFESVDLSMPDSNQTLAALIQTEVAGSISLPFATPYFTQTENGNLILEAYSESGKTYWLTESKSAPTGKLFYTSPLSEMTESSSTSSPLLVCDSDNQSCENGGDTTIQLTPRITETIETEYAKFDAYKFNINWTASVLNIDQSGDSKSYSLSGSQWIYPPLGVVRFEYSIQTQQGDITTYIGTLSATNIKIPDANKLDS